eukprot:TRINITY_DN42873_c0_g1_i1.p1 TRINITY_DN42873_c0_g1~~TRINITY_DN42873_c0_g1_i1.p1  ORF type:complete len:323 (-),score=42.81 TRINITY_DN42873_c0_g1_i1:79-1047(-)
MADKSRKELRLNLAASAATGCVIMTITNPVDTLRCRWQVVGGAEQTLAGFTRTVIRQEGLWGGLWRPGLPPNMVGMALAIGGRNGFYPVVRDSVSAFTGSGEKVGPTGMFAAGLLAGMAGYFMATPFLQVKTQMQAESGKVGADGLYGTGARTGQAPSYRSTFNAFSTLASNGYANSGVLGGVANLWRGSSVVVGRGAVVAASQLSAYDSTKTFLKAQGYGDGPVIHFVASQVGAFFCTTCSMPLDVVLTVFTTASTIGGERKAIYGSGGPLACATAMLRRDGPRVFFRGWTPAFIRISPTTTSSFFLYEQLRRILGLGYLD